MDGNKTTIINALTVDVEDYFHVAALAKAIDRSEWDTLAPRVETNTRRLIEIFADANVSATFFVLGWVAERFPALVREIVAAGHELACHGYSHQLIYQQKPQEFEQETRRAKALLEDVSGSAIRGYRAASYSINRQSAWALDIIAQAGFRYDSSIVAVRHDLYGIPGARQWPHVLRTDQGREIREFPPSTINLFGQNIPVGGGGYFRIFPFWFSCWGMRRINAVCHKPFAFYLHPWEIDPNQPRVPASLKSRFRHYHNLAKTEPRLEDLLRQFEFSTMAAVLDQLVMETVDFGDIVGAAGRQTV